MRLGLLILSLVLTSACASALTAIRPGASEQAQVRQVAARVADAVRTSFVVLDHAAVLVNALPLSTEQKDALDCGILKATGLDTPSDTVRKVCGPLPTTQTAPLRIALRELQAVTREASLRQTLARIVMLMESLVTKLEGVHQPALVSTAAILRASFAIAVAYLTGGGS